MGKDKGAKDQGAKDQKSEQPGKDAKREIRRELAAQWMSGKNK